MTITLSTSLQKRIEARVADGEFDSADDLVEQAVQALLDDDEESERLRAEVAVGLADLEAGRVSSFDLDQFLAEMRRKHVARPSRSY